MAENRFGTPTDSEPEGVIRRLEADVVEPRRPTLPATERSEDATFSVTGAGRRACNS